MTGVGKMRAHMGADQVTRFARVDFHSDERIFGIKDEDRLLHLYTSARRYGKNDYAHDVAESGHSIRFELKFALDSVGGRAPGPF